MKKEKYIDLIYDISKYYNNNKLVEITINGQSYIRLLQNSIYGSFGKNWRSQEPSINDIRCEKIEKIINKI